MDFYVIISLISIIIWFSITILFYHIHWFTRITASNTATNDVRNLDHT